jgi:hypothetical protein
VDETMKGMKSCADCDDSQGAFCWSFVAGLVQWAREQQSGA